MDDVRWLSYGELAEARGISKASAQRLVMRRRWARRRGNDQTVRVAVPIGEDAPKHDDTGNVRSDIKDDITHVVSVLQTAVTSLTERAQAAERRADRADTEAARLRDQLTKAEVARAEFWARSRFARLKAVWRGR